MIKKTLLLTLAFIMFSISINAQFGGPGDCDRCDSSIEGYADFIYSTLSGNDCTYELSYPTYIEIACRNTTFTIDWNGVSDNLIRPGDTIQTTFSNSDDQDITITVITGNILCSYDYTITDINCDDICPPPPCPLTVEINPEEIDDCLYNFSATNNIDSCNSGIFQYGWNIYDLVNNVTVFASTQSTVNFQFTNDSQYRVEYNIRFEGDDGFICKATEVIILDINCAGRSSTSPIKMSPNPSKSNSRLQFDGLDYKKIDSIEIFDLNGRSKGKISPIRNALNLPQLSKGIYIIHFITKNGITQKKLIIE